MTADEKLAELRAGHPDWEIDWGGRYAAGGAIPHAFKATARRLLKESERGPRFDIYDKIVRVRTTALAALDALAEALAKLEGVTIPRKVALALALVSAGRWSKFRAVGEVMAWANVVGQEQHERWGDQIFAALGTSEDEAFEEMRD